MSVHQTSITIPPKRRGCHLITREIQSAISSLPCAGDGLAELFLQHTSASLTINENASPDVRVDMETILNAIVPEDASYRHSMEGADDMPAHAKCSLLGVGLTVPLTGGRLALGTWQGIYLCEHRTRASSRTIVITVID